MWYKLSQNFNSLQRLVLEISTFEFDAYYGFCAGAGVREFFVGGMLSDMIHS